MDGLWKALLVEFVGTFAFVFVGTAAAAVTLQQGGSVLGTALAWGLILLALISAWTAYSGAHFNPAVSFGFAVAGRMGWGVMIFYWIAQILGSLEEAKNLGRFRWAQPDPGFGPWPITPQTEVGVVWRVPNKLRKPDHTPLRIGLPGVVEVTAADAEFIANARTDVPRLVSEIRRLRALLSEHPVPGNGIR